MQVKENPIFQYAVRNLFLLGLLEPEIIVAKIKKKLNVYFREVYLIGV